MLSYGVRSDLLLLGDLFIDCLRLGDFVLALVLTFAVLLLWATTLEIAFLSLFKLSRANFAEMRDYDCVVSLTCSGNLVKLNNFVNKRDVGIAQQLRLAYDFGIPT